MKQKFRGKRSKRQEYREEAKVKQAQWKGPTIGELLRAAIERKEGKR